MMITTSLEHQISLVLKLFQRPAVFCLVLILSLSLPFVNKAFHIDDYFFLTSSDLFDWNPLRVFPKDYLYQGMTLSSVLPFSSTHPLLIPYLLKVLQFLFGRSEVPLHLAFLLFPLLALLSLAKLQAAISREGQARILLLVVLFGSLPAFVVNGQNLMSDVPTLAFLLAGTAVIVQSVLKETSPWWGSFWLTCAVFSAYQALAFLPVLLLFVLIGCRHNRHKWELSAVLMLPVIIMLIWLIWVYVLYGVFPGLKSSDIGGEVARGMRWEVMWGKVIFNVAMIGASLLFLLPLRAICCKTRSIISSGIYLGVLGAVFFVLAPEEAGEIPRRTALAAFCALGTFGLGLAYGDLSRWWSVGSQKKFVVLCGSWMAVVLLYNLVLPFGSSRYLLPLFPILFIVLLRGVDLLLPRSLRLVAFLACCSLVWGGAQAWADYYYAGTYRSMAGEIAKLRHIPGNDRRVWYIGEWGMRHYFDEAGARYLSANSREPRSGDFLVIPEMPRFWTPPPQLRPQLAVYAQREYRSPIPLRLFNRRSGAGFYSHHWGVLPFAISTEPDEVFLIFELR